MRGIPGRVFLLGLCVSFREVRCTRCSQRLLLTSEARGCALAVSADCAHGFACWALEGAGAPARNLRRVVAHARGNLQTDVPPALATGWAALHQSAGGGVLQRSAGLGLLGLELDQLLQHLPTGDLFLQSADVARHLPLVHLDPLRQQHLAHVNVVDRKHAVLALQGALPPSSADIVLDCDDHNVARNKAQFLRAACLELPLGHYSGHRGLRRVNLLCRVRLLHNLKPAQQVGPLPLAALCVRRVRRLNGRRRHVISERRE
mmetsp:Transcript_19399/g.74488  ORF Transcript_19399/g.74488 Transcript_19399/m.74488 type:complete len:261 (+) Transcript_19399:416-1198(+)